MCFWHYIICNPMPQTPFGSKSCYEEEHMSWFSRFMYGRYGNDQFSLFLVSIYLLFAIANIFLNLTIIWLLAFVPLIFAFWRMMSRNIPKRRAENAAFMRHWSKITKLFKRSRMRRKDKEHRYFKCSNCRATLRVPRGVGKIVVTCPACKSKTDKRA